MINKANINYDLVRLVACILVVLHHTFGIKPQAYPTLYLFTSTCVPLFILLSGSLLLNQKYSILVFYKKRLSKILLPALFWILFYSLFRMAKDFYVNGSFSYYTILKNSIGINGWPYYHLWYLYLIFLLYIITPVLQHIHLLFREKNKLLIQIILCVLLLFFVFACEDVWLEYLTIYCLGGVISTVINAVDIVYQKIAFVTLVLLAFLCFVFNLEHALGLISPILIFISLLRFPIIKGRIYSVLISLTFGIYLIHPLIIESFSLLTENGWIYKSDYLEFFVAFGFSSVITLLVKKVYFLREMI